jgi:hypothetical protein
MSGTSPGLWSTTPLIVAGLLVAGPSSAAGGSESMQASPLYQLLDTPLLFTSSRWAVPLTLRIEAAAGLAPNHELRLSSDATLPAPGPDLLQTGPAPVAGRRPLEPARATYRYTFHQGPQWALKLGLTANLNQFDSALRAGLQADRPGFGALPMLHFAGEGRFARHWSLSVAADGMMTTRGHAYDLGLRVNYLLGPSFAVYGGYRLTDAAGEAEDPVVPRLGSTANIGMRYRF